MANKSGLSNAEANDGHKIRLYTKGIGSTINLPDLPENVFSTNKGDLW